MSENISRKAFLSGYLEGIIYASGPVEEGKYIGKENGRRVKISKLVSSISSMINNRTIEWLTKR